MKKIITIEGLKCEKCSARLEKVFNNQEGIVATVSFEEKKAFLELSKEYSDEELKEIVEDTGFEALTVE